jgi:hypothetical protein
VNDESKTTLQTVRCPDGVHRFNGNDGTGHSYIDWESFYAEDLAWNLRHPWRAWFHRFFRIEITLIPGP